MSTKGKLTQKEKELIAVGASVEKADAIAKTIAKPNGLVETEANDGCDNGCGCQAG